MVQHKHRLIGLVVFALGAVLWLWGVKFLDADTAAAEEREAGAQREPRA